MIILILTFLIYPGESLKSLVEKSYISSPFIKQLDANIEILDAAKSMIHSYHYPELNFTQGIYNSTSPLSVFAFKLEEAQINQSDFNPTLLNNPNDRTTNKSSLTLKIPIYTAGQLSYKEEALSMQKKSVEEQKLWVKKVLRKNIYGLYYALEYLNDFEKFLDEEAKYLQNLLNFYDAKTAVNQNRYLSYNKGKIISVSIEEAKLDVLNSKNNILEDLKYLTGLEALTIPNIDNNSEDIFNNIYWKGFKNSQKLNRQDLAALESMIASHDKDLSSDKGKFIPNLGAFANYSLNTEDFSKSADNYTVGLVLSWDIGLSKFKGIDLAKSKKYLSELEYENKKASIDNELNKQFDNLTNLEQKIQKLENKHQIYLENKKILSSQYKKGSMDLYNLLDNFAYYIENRGTLAKVKAEYKLSLADYINNYVE